ncbi:hypothetical protein AMJ44_03875 [candidate division WOR-1 bacterium DG_54_3]|uniref:Orotidine 5'-phosphate decarboxylase n=1 Tax=candidate division WOR-1 bacterium DG_54_3 TaxID=1703775 RepID=A0A0S7Y5K0_UNCSA|nr:MAG: hypothetical protein AMJ44_03875 [candidate division WOR-1 bacterium DG_54_3]
MKFVDYLDSTTKKNDSLLCVGLDIDLSRIPHTFLNKEDPIFNFNKEIILATKELVCAYKLNIAFYEMYGIYGLEALKRTIEYIQEEEIPAILDAKRGDIGNSSLAYAKAVFEVYKADATTVNPYLGYDSIEPFIEFRNKGVFVLCLTSNPGRYDFQTRGEKEPLYKVVAKRVKELNKNKNLGLVVGATNPEEIKGIRAMAEDMPILIPGIGAQGGNLEAAAKYGPTKNGTRAIISVSRSIIYAGKGEDFAGQAKAEARKLKDMINQYRRTG